MKISKSVNFLPDYFRTLSNRRFLDSTVDRLFSEPQIERFDGFVGRQIDPITGQVLSGPYIQEDTAMRQNYQLETNYVTRDSNNNIQGVVGWEDLLNTVANKSGVTTDWNRLLTGNMYSWRGFVDVDKIINYQNYYWVPQNDSSTSWYWNNSVRVSNSNISLNESFTITREPNGLAISNFNNLNPEISLVRGGTYNFNVTENTVSPQTRVAHSIENLSIDSITYVSADISNPYFNNTTGLFSNGDSLLVSPATDLVLAGTPFTIETFVSLSENGPGIIAGIADDDNNLASWQLIQNSDNTLAFNWIDSVSGQTMSLTTAALNLNEWYFVAVTRSAGTIRLYVNGFLSNSVQYIGSIAHPNYQLNIGSFNGSISNFRISLNIARYTESLFAVPDNSLVNDNFTQLLIGFDADPGSTVFLDNNNVVLSKIWIQNNPGIDGAQTFNPSITARNIDGVVNNGISNGILTITIPTIEDNQPFIDLFIAPNGQNYVDLATTLDFDQINGQSFEQFNIIPGLNENSNITGHWGGVDGITNLDGRTLIFISNPKTGWGSVPESEWFGIWNISVVDGIIQLTYNRDFLESHRITVTNGVEYRLNDFYQQNSSINLFPSAANLYPEFFLQDDSAANRVLKLNILEANYLSQLNVKKDIIGQAFYTSGNGIEFKNGLIVSFDSTTLPLQFSDTTKRWIVEGVGQSIILIPVSDLIVSESVLLQNNPADYITINRASPDRNSWSNTNQWIHKDTFNSAINLLTQQGLIFTTSPSSAAAVRPIIEYNAGLQLYGFGQIALQAATYLDQFTLDAFSNVQNKTSYQIDSDQINDGDIVVFNADTNPLVRQTTYRINFVDSTNTLPTPINRLEPVLAATTANSTITGLLLIDGYQTKVGDRILVWKQSDSTQNGIYNVSTGAWVRSNDAANNTNFQNYFGVFVLNGLTFANGYFNYNLNSNTIIGITAISFIESSIVPVIELTPVQTAQSDSAILILAGKSFSDQNLFWNSVSQNWTFALQSKTTLQQYPLFDLFDSNGISCSDISIYSETTFAGSRLFSYAVGNGIVDPVLGLVLDYGLIGNLNDIIFKNDYDVDTFSYQLNGQILEMPVNFANASRVSPITLSVTKYDSWQYINSNLELYQNLNFTGINFIQIPGQLLIKDKKNSQPNKVFVDGKQLDNKQFAITQSLINGSPTIIVDIHSSLINVDSSIFVKLITISAIKNAYYDVPPCFDQNPLGQNFEMLTMSDIRNHATASFSNINKNITEQSTYFPVSLQNIAFNGIPGSLLHHEIVSALPTLMLTNPEFDIDQALKSAGEDYVLFKQKFLNTSQTITNIQNLTSKDAVDKIMTALNATNVALNAWNMSDMIPVDGTLTSYKIVTPQLVNYNTKYSYDFTQPNNTAILVYLNNIQLVKDRDYIVPIGKNIISITSLLKIGDVLSIYEIINTDGCFVPATPTKLGLSAAYVPCIYLDTTYRTPIQVIKGHDGSITKTYGDYRDNLLLELELRIFNNLKVNNQLWTDTIEAHVPTNGRFRNEQALTNLEIQPYTTSEQLNILQRMYYEWIATNHINTSVGYYNSADAFTWNYSNCLDKFKETNGLSNLPGYWRGIYNYFYDTNNVQNSPWEALNIAIKPSWWEEVYGPAPYTGQSLIWQDIAKGVINNPTGSTISSFGTRIILEGSVEDVLPIDQSGILIDPNQAVVGVFNDTNIDGIFVFGDQGPVESAWRQNSIYPFAKLRAQIIQNPLFMLGLLWDLNNYLPTNGWNEFRYINNKFGSLSDVDTTQRVNSILNYSIEYLRQRGTDPVTMQTTLDNTQVNLVYDMAGFAAIDDLTVYAGQNNPVDQGSSVQLPQEDVSLFLSESVPTGTLVYSGVIITKTQFGYSVSGYNPDNPFFMVLPAIVGPYTTITVGASSYKVYTNFSDTAMYVPYNYTFADQQSVVNFLIGYGRYLTNAGLQFDPTPTQERISWQDVTVQFIKWSMENWSAQTLSLILNPAASILEFIATNGTLQNLTNHVNQIFDVNQKVVSNKYLNVYREGNTTKIIHQAGNVIAGLKANIVSFEHRLVVNNTTVFDDVIYVPNTGLRQNRLRIVGQKTANWNGTLDIPGFMIVTNQVQSWKANSDYLQGTVVSFKNANYVATTNIIGAQTFQYTQFTVITTTFTNTIIPNLAVKAQDLTHAYDSEYRTYIEDFVRLRSNTIGYIERDWLSGLGIDLASQTDFYRGWLKEKGSLNAINAYGRGSTSTFNTQVSIYQEYAVRVGDYGATARTGFGDVQITPDVNNINPIVIQFVDIANINISDTIQVTPNSLYEKSLNWNNDFVQLQGTINAQQQNLLTAGPILPNTIINYAANVVPQLNSEDTTALFYASISDFANSIQTENILKIAEHGGMFWIANDNVMNDNNWNVIKFTQANAYVQSINRISNSTVQFNLTSDINAVVNSIVMVDHVDDIANISIQGAFIISAYDVAPTNASISTITITSSNAAFNFNTINYNPPFSQKTIYLEQSLRASSIGNIGIIENEQFVFVENDIDGSAGYQLIEPYTNQVTQELVAGQSPNFGVAYDAIENLLWASKPGALNNSGRIELYNVYNSKNEADVSVPTLNILNIQEVVTQRNDSYGLGDVLVTLQNGFIAAHSSQINSNIGMVYICRSANSSVQANQILSVDGWSGTLTNIGFGTSMATSLDGNWLYIGSNSSNTIGQVSAYMLTSANTAIYTPSTLINNTITLIGDIIPYNAYSLRIIVTDEINGYNSQLLIPTLEYSVTGSNVSFNINLSSQATFQISQLDTFFNYVTTIQNVNIPNTAKFGTSIACDETGETVAIGSPNINSGQVTVYRRIIEKMYFAQQTSTIIPHVSLVANNAIKLIINGNVASKNDYVIQNNSIVLNNPMPIDSSVQVEANNFTLLQTIFAPNINDKAFGQSIALRNNQLVIGAPDSIRNINNRTIFKKGAFYFYCLDTSMSVFKTVPINQLFSYSQQQISINDWILIVSGNSISQLVNSINDRSIYTGVIANVSSDGLNLILAINPTAQTSGIVTTFSAALNSQYILVESIESNDIAEYGQGQAIKWLSTDLFGVVSNYSAQFVAAELDTFADGTYFDSDNTVFYDGTTEPTQILKLYQILRSSASWIDQITDAIQVVPVKTIQVSGQTGSSIIYDGNINNIWIGNSADNIQPINLYYNPTLVHGWTKVTQESTPIEPRSIGRAWLYNSLTNTKIIDLEVVDLRTGLLPGSIVQELDYVCDIDPAIYGYSLWQPGVTYAIEDRVFYNNQLWQSLNAGRSGSIFNVNLWQLVNTTDPFVNVGPTKWDSTQIGKTWFKTTGLKVIDAQVGNLQQRATNWNSWFPNSSIEVYQWINSTVSPVLYPQSNINGFISDINCPYSFDTTSGLYGFWVTGLQSVGPIHNMAISDIASALLNVTSAGIPIITPIDTNSIAVWNINSYIENDNVILHIDYVTKSSNNNLHSEFVLLSNNGDKTWMNTPLYSKFIDSLVGQTVNSQLVPDITISQNQQYGVEVNPQQTIFVNRATALLIYYEEINKQIANIAINSSSLQSALSGISPQPTSGFNQTVPNRTILNTFDNSQYPQNYRILVVTDSSIRNNGWTIVANMSGIWQIVDAQLYDLQTMWKEVDWIAPTYNNQYPPIYTINNIGELPSITLIVGITIGILNNGNGDYAVYQVVENDIDNTVLELNPVYIQNGTIQFLPELYNFEESGIGFDESPFDTIRYWDDDPYNEIRLITQALNNEILIGNFSNIADNSFFAILNYIIYENKNLDWLFKTSFVSVDYPTSNLIASGSYTAGNTQIVQNFVTETLPYHTRIRQFNDIYNANDYANISVTDFDLPAEYDVLYAQLINQFTNNVQSNDILQLQQFHNNVGMGYDRSRFYISSSGIPDYVTNAFPTANVPFPATAQDWIFAIKRNGSANDSISYATINNGPIAITIDGVPIYSPNSNQTQTLYDSANIQVSQTFTINTVYADIMAGIDPGAGYPDVNGAFHVLSDPYLLYSKNINVHSPIIGYAFDGNPIYGPYGFENVDGTGNIIQNLSSYQLNTTIRLDKTNQPIANGIQLAVLSTPTGEYIEDFEFVQDSGTLDKFNGRFCVTPEYPQGTYAYFVTVDNSNVSIPIYPYVIGPDYWGIPTGLHYEYINNINTPIYTNGNYTMPNKNQQQPIVRSPDGTISTDAITLSTSNTYAAWNEFHTYYIASIDVIRPGIGYDNPVVNIVSLDGNGGGATASAIVDSATGILAINVTNTGSGYTTTPQIIVTDANATIQCQAYPRLQNLEVRKITTELRFDRVSTEPNYFNANLSYANNSVVFDTVTKKYFQAIVAQPTANLANTQAWSLASNIAIATSTAYDRTMTLYEPTSNMPANKAKLLMSGFEYPGVYVSDKKLPNSYAVPNGPIHDVDDSLVSLTPVNITWDPGLLTQSAFNTQIVKFGQQSGKFAANTNTYIQLDTANSIDANAIVLNSNDFTLEFFCRFSTLENITNIGDVVPTEMTIIDTRANDSSDSGYTIFKTVDNQFAFSTSNIADPIIIGGAVVTNDWIFVTIQRSGNAFTMYQNGQQIGSYNYANTSPSFSDVALTFGSDITGNNILNGYIDEFRLTSNTTRYTFDSETLTVPTVEFPRTLSEDPYLTSRYTLLLYGFESAANESEIQVQFSAVNSNTYIQDISWDSKNIQLVNYDLNNIKVNAQEFSNIGEPVFTLTLNI